MPEHQWSCLCLDVTITRPPQHQRSWLCLAGTMKAQHLVGAMKEVLLLHYGGLLPSHASHLAVTMKAQLQCLSLRQRGPARFVMAANGRSFRLTVEQPCARPPLPSCRRCCKQHLEIGQLQELPHSPLPSFFFDSCMSASLALDKYAPPPPPPPPLHSRCTSRGDGRLFHSRCDPPWYGSLLLPLVWKPPPPHCDPSCALLL